MAGRLSINPQEILKLFDELDSQDLSDLSDEDELSVSPSVTVEMVQEMAKKLKPVDKTSIERKANSIQSEENLGHDSSEEESGNDDFDEVKDPTYQPESTFEDTESEETLEEPLEQIEDHSQRSTTGSRDDEATHPAENEVSSKKRKRNPNSWKSSLCKIKSAKGECFTNSKGTKVAPKKVGPDCKCKKQCLSRLGEETVQRVFKEFYQLANKRLQDSYLFGLIHSKPVARRRSRTGARGDYRKASYKYTVRHADGSRVEVCAAAFRSIHGIGKSRFEKLRKPNLTLTPNDKRGKHGYHRKIGETTRQKVRDHIDIFPKQQSHYSRHQNPQKTYLPENLSVRRMWLLYLVENEPEQIYNLQQNKTCTAKVKLHLYREEFNKLNIGFGLPKSDTCQKCDQLQIAIMNAEANDPSRATELKAEKEKHHRKAEKGYAMLANFSELAKKSTEIDVYTFDFQQNLPVPNLTTSDMFYSRMLWVYNFGLHDASTGDGIMHMWDETVAKRGSSEVCSCLKSTVLERKTEAKHLVLFSDSCCGQNKNKAILTMLAQMASNQNYDQIDHFYLVRGHTFLPNDRDFALIEKYKKKHHPLLPVDYVDIIKNSRISQPFEVKSVKTGNIDDYKSMADKIVKTTLKDQNSNIVKVRDAVWYSYGQSQEMDFEKNEQVTVAHPGQVWCRYTYNDMEPWKKFDLLKRNSSLATRPQPRYKKPLPIKAAKYKDLIQLGHKGLVPGPVYQYYTSLPHENTETTVSVESDSEGDDGGDFI